MTGLVRFNYIRDAVRSVAPNIWISDPPELSLAGQDVAFGWWDGSDPDDPDDVGKWTLQEDNACNPPVHFPGNLTNQT
jgi:hypothetical protein